jgi:hypothetical protein
MTAKKSKRLLSVDFLDNHPEQIELARFLSSGWDAKSKVIAATKSHFYAIALADNPNSSDEDLQIAVLDSLRCLWLQMGYIVDYCNIKRNSNLSLESLMQFGSVPTYQSRSTPPTVVGKASPAENRVHSAGADLQHRSLSEDEDEYEFDEIEAGIQLAPALVTTSD